MKAWESSGDRALKAAGGFAKGGGATGRQMAGEASEAAGRSSARSVRS